MPLEITAPRREGPSVRESGKRQSPFGEDPVEHGQPRSPESRASSRSWSRPKTSSRFGRRPRRYKFLAAFEELPVPAPALGAAILDPSRLPPHSGEQYCWLPRGRKKALQPLRAQSILRAYSGPSIDFFAEAFDVPEFFICVERRKGARGPPGTGRTTSRLP